jgi:hypothetical protein
VDFSLTGFKVQEWALLAWPLPFCKVVGFFYAPMHIHPCLPECCFTFFFGQLSHLFQSCIGSVAVGLCAFRYASTNYCTWVGEAMTAISSCKPSAARANLVGSQSSPHAGN